jgi:hypothetical protein
LVVEWPAPDRAALESQLLGGITAVRYEGCELQVLRQCKAKAKYSYIPITPKQERVTMKDSDELYGSIPVYAAKFEAALQKSGQLNVAMTIVGMWESQRTKTTLADFEGDCAEATHVISSVAVGAYEFFAGDEAEAGASAAALGASAGARSASKREDLSRDGRSESCDNAKRGDATPPDGCGAILRLELSPLSAAPTPAEAASAAASAAPKQAAAPIRKGSTLAPEDASFEDTKNGVGWGERCYQHIQAGALEYARAACERGLAQQADSGTQGAILYNMARIEDKAGDKEAMCGYLRRSLSVRPGNKTVQKRLDENCK